MFASSALSVAAAQRRRRPAPSLPSRRGAAAGRHDSRVTVLVVEDDEGTRQSVAEILLDEGYEVLTASNGADALSLLRTSPAPDAILLDLMMPVMDGWRFRVEQKREPHLADIPVIAMSTKATSQAKAIDAAAFAAKPLRFDELSQTIERVVSAARSARMEHTDRLAALGTLTAGVAHEISSPLTYVIANLDQVARELPAALEGTDSELPSLIDEALDGARRITDIVRNIQTVAHLVRKSSSALVDLRGCVERSVKILQHELRQRAELRLELDPVPPVRANAGRLEQVVINLLMNACRAVDDRRGHVITVATRMVPPGRARLEVADTGPGVPPHLRERIFEPFFTTRSVGSGTGLGLSICRSIIADAGGEIGVLSAPQGGALFWFELPPAPASVVAGTAAAPAGRTEPPLRVLAIDDDARVLGALQRLASATHEVRVAAGVEQALAACAQWRPDLILLDVMIPGSTVERNLGRVREAWPDLAGNIVLMTGGPFTEREQAVVRGAGCPVLTKPFTLDELVGAYRPKN